MTGSRSSTDLALHLDRPLVGTVGAGDHLDQRRLPRAVLAHQRVHLARAQVERHPLEGLHAGERLADARQPQHVAPWSRSWVL